MAAKGSIHLKSGLPPVVDSGTRVLVLGSLPSDESIRLQQYYGNPRNHFWSIIYKIFDGGRPDDDYSRRIIFLKSLGFGLWDVLQSASRKGSADSSIRNKVPNDIAMFLDRYPRIEKVLLNGTRAREYYRKFCGNARIDGLYVPSSSPRPGRNVLTLERKMEKWNEVMRSAP